MHTYFHCNCLLYFIRLSDGYLNVFFFIWLFKLLVQNLILKKYVQRDTQQTFLQFLWSLIELYSFEIVDQGKIFAYARNYKFLTNTLKYYICEGCMNEWRENLWKLFRWLDGVISYVVVLLNKREEAFKLMSCCCEERILFSSADGKLNQLMISFLLRYFYC